MAYDLEGEGAFIYLKLYYNLASDAYNGQHSMSISGLALCEHTWLPTKHPPLPPLPCMKLRRPGIATIFIASHVNLFCEATSAL